MRWAAEPAPPSLGGDEVHVWRVSLDKSSLASGGAFLPLSEDERARAARFRFDVDRYRFSVGRTALRNILAAYVGLAPARLVFREGPHGKPALEGIELEFNLSHSSEYALIAVSRRRRVGVDVERIRADFASQAVARRFFAAAEVAALAASAPHEYPTAFFRCWTRKEAYVKARGDGLTLELDRFEVPLEVEARRAVASCLDDPSELSRWELRELQPARGYMGALVAEGHGWTVRALDGRSLVRGTGAVYGDGR
jgi:4'-phosphopantetheinyl transferase